MTEEIKKEKPGLDKNPEASQAAEQVSETSVEETAASEEEKVNWGAFEDKNEPEKPAEPEELGEKTEAPQTPETPLSPQTPEKDKPIEPPKEGLAPEQEAPTYSDGDVRPNNLAGMGIPGSETPGKQLGSLKEQVKKSEPISEIKESIRGKGDPVDVSKVAAEMHNEHDLDKAA